VRPFVDFEARVVDEEEEVDMEHGSFLHYYITMPWPQLYQQLGALLISLLPRAAG
jgi:hypothetical protein